ncbi:hypothetical protein HN873_050981, partial [Arachis hypogaea]
SSVLQQLNIDFNIQKFMTRTHVSLVAFNKVYGAPAVQRLMVGSNITPMLLSLADLRCSSS